MRWVCWAVSKVTSAKSDLIRRDARQIFDDTVMEVSDQLSPKGIAGKIP